ncbi:uncharacterized protein LOC116300277 [Actinia tenebrosa]|uniref:Uncharacterized protein LOC116300277 n=1 Tax=Actinia tenebrosa TaxID=6105 RepID=A0A6P8I8T1_ACTTE|nr:uncharacterized protein LOC116300277 [Actinia tenebrosa]
MKAFTFGVILLVLSLNVKGSFERIKREDVRRVAQLTNSRWSSWYTALVPRAPRRNAKNYERRDEGHYGFIYSKIRERFLSYDDGIYELRVVRGNRKPVVYIGMAHRDGPGSMNQRILEYCRDGSHKGDLINRAMRLGYTLQVRVQNIPGSAYHVRECEKKYLDAYDYAWNEINNGRIRGNVPSP